MVDVIGHIHQPFLVEPNPIADALSLEPDENLPLAVRPSPPGGSLLGEVHRVDVPLGITGWALDARRELIGLRQRRGDKELAGRIGGEKEQEEQIHGEVSLMLGTFESYFTPSADNRAVASASAFC